MYLLKFLEADCQIKYLAKKSEKDCPPIVKIIALK